MARVDKSKSRDASDLKKEVSVPEGGPTARVAAKTLTFRGLAAATKNFRPECLLGEGGGFGSCIQGPFGDHWTGYLSHKRPYSNPRYHIFWQPSFVSPDVKGGQFRVLWEAMGSSLGNHHKIQMAEDLFCRTLCSIFIMTLKKNSLKMDLQSWAPWVTRPMLPPGLWGHAGTVIQKMP